MTSTQEYPSIETFVKGYAGELNAETFLAKLMNDTFLGSVAPILLMTRQELNWIPKFGLAKRKFIAAKLQETGLRFRDSNQALSARALELYGNFDAVPVQALLLSAQRTLSNVMSVEYSQSAILRTVIKLDATATLGSFLAGNVEDALSDIFYNADEWIDHLQFSRGVDDLTTRLEYWKLASS